MSSANENKGSLCGSIEEMRARQALKQMDAAMDTLKEIMQTVRLEPKEKDE